jgi:type IV pilus assembly protein PilQ
MRHGNRVAAKVAAFCLLALALAVGGSTAATLTGVTVTSEGDLTRIHVLLNQPVEWSHFVLNDPPRLYVDCRGVESVLPKKLPQGDGRAGKIEASIWKGEGYHALTRLTVDLARPSRAEVKTVEDGLLIVLGPTEGGEWTVGPEPTPATSESSTSTGAGTTNATVTESSSHAESTRAPAQPPATPAPTESSKVTASPLPVPPEGTPVKTAEAKTAETKTDKTAATTAAKAYGPEAAPTTTASSESSGTSTGTRTTSADLTPAETMNPPARTMNPTMNPEVTTTTTPETTAGAETTAGTTTEATPTTTSPKTSTTTKAATTTTPSGTTSTTTKAATTTTSPKTSTTANTTTTTTPSSTASTTANTATTTTPSSTTSTATNTATTTTPSSTASTTTSAAAPTTSAKAPTTPAEELTPEEEDTPSPAPVPEESAYRAPEPATDYSKVRRTTVKDIPLSEEKGLAARGGARVSLDIQGADIYTVLRSISEYSGVNIVMGYDVANSVKNPMSFHLENVPWGEALEMVLRSAHLWYREEGNIIRVDTEENLRNEELAGANAARQLEDVMPLTTRIVEVIYANASELKPTVEKSLSKRGVIEVDERTNSLVVTDIRSRVDAAVEMVQHLDSQTPQVEITAKLVDVDARFERDLGVIWNVNGLHADGASADGSFGANDVVDPTAQVRFGVVRSWGTVSAVLAAMERDNKANIISNPRITTVNNREARILVGQKIPLIVLDEAGNPITQLTTIGITLRVTPHINDQNRITLDMHPEVSDLASQATVQGGVIINTSEADTRVMVGNGETAVIGGLIRANDAKLKRGVPILKDVPVVGAFFSSTTTVREKRELLIFVTPKIVNAFSATTGQ